MKKTEIIKKNYQFKEVLSKGKYISGKYIEGFYIQTDNNKLGIAVSKKAGNSVHRNKIKRLIKEAYRIKEDFIIDGISIVFLWKKKNVLDDIKYFNIELDIINIFEKIKL